MPRAQPARYVIRDPAQLRSLSSPVRQEILDALSASGPRTSAELGRLLGRRPQALYYHLRALERVGLLQAAGTKRCGKSDARLYATPAPRLVIEYQLGSRSFVGQMTRTLRTMLRLTERDFRRALRFQSVVVEGPRRNLCGSRIKARLTAEQVGEINRALTVAIDRMAGLQGQAAGRHHALTTVIVPLEEGS